MTESQRQDIRAQQPPGCGGAPRSPRSAGRWLASAARAARATRTGENPCRLGPLSAEAGARSGRGRMRPLGRHLELEHRLSREDGAKSMAVLDRRGSIRYPIATSLERKQWSPMVGARDVVVAREGNAE